MSKNLLRTPSHILSLLRDCGFINGNLRLFHLHANINRQGSTSGICIAPIKRKPNESKVHNFCRKQHNIQGTYVGFSVPQTNSIWVISSRFSFARMFDSGKVL